MTNSTEHFNQKIKSGEISLTQSPCLCGLETDVGLFEHERFGFIHKTVICKFCGLIRNNPRPSEDFYSEFYQNDDYRLLHEGKHFREKALRRFKNSTFIFDKIEQLRLLQDIDHVFEFGCGAGWNLSKFAIAEKNVVGLEANATLVELGQEKGLDVQVGSFVDLDKIENPVDLLILNHVLEHFHDPVDKLKRLRAMVRADGYIYIGVPNLDNFHFGQFQIAHLYYFSSRVFLAYMETLNLELIDKGKDAIHQYAIFRVPKDFENKKNFLEPPKLEFFRLLAKYYIYKALAKASRLKTFLKRFR